MYHPRTLAATSGLVSWTAAFTESLDQAPPVRVKRSAVNNKIEVPRMSTAVQCPTSGRLKQFKSSNFLFLLTALFLFTTGSIEVFGQG
jgi:hypothetical protein